MILRLSRHVELEGVARRVDLDRVVVVIVGVVVVIIMSVVVVVLNVLLL